MLLVILNRSQKRSSSEIRHALIFESVGLHKVDYRSFAGCGSCVLRVVRGMFPQVAGVGVPCFSWRLRGVSPPTSFRQKGPRRSVRAIKSAKNWRETYVSRRKFTILAHGWYNAASNARPARGMLREAVSVSGAALLVAGASEPKGRLGSLARARVCQ